MVRAVDMCLRGLLLFDVMLLSVGWCGRREFKGEKLCLIFIAVDDNSSRRLGRLLLVHNRVFIIVQLEHTTLDAAAVEQGTPLRTGEHPSRRQSSHRLSKEAPASSQQDAW
jgi:hypothetical protein